MKIDFFKNAHNKNYIYFAKRYIYDKVFYGGLILLIVIPVLFLKAPWNMLEIKTKEIITYQYDDKKLENVSGTVKIVDDQGVLRYQGEVEQGVCQGQGKLYDQNGQLVYEGSFINNKFEGDLGTLYKDGEVLYQGGFRENMYQGIGQLYHDEHYLYQEGSFMNGQLEGEGTDYKEDGNILYTGYFSNGLYDKSGVLYDEDYNRIYYDGEFVKGIAEGQGKLLDNTGFTYYQGKMHEGSIDYSAFLGESLETLENSFRHHYEIFIYKDMTLFVYREENIMFITHSPLTIHYSSKKQLKDFNGQDVFIDEVELDKSLDKKDTLIDSILLMDCQLLPKTKEAKTIDDVDKAIDKYLGDMKTDVETYYPTFIELVERLYDKKSLNASQLGSYVYSFPSVQKTSLSMNMYDIEDVRYTYAYADVGTIQYVLIEKSPERKS